MASSIIENIHSVEDVSDKFVVNNDTVYTVNLKEIYRTGNVISGTVNFKPKPKSNLANTTFFTIDQSIVPATHIYPLAVFRDGGEASTTPLLLLAELYNILRIPNNTANLYIGAVNENDFIQISFTYIIRR